VFFHGSAHALHPRCSLSRVHVESGANGIRQSLRIIGIDDEGIV
jgi:hypothetical protein